MPSFSPSSKFWLFSNLLLLLVILAFPRPFYAQSQDMLDAQLYSAVIDGDAKAVQRLLDQGANVNAKGGLGGSPLDQAVSQGHLEVVKVLIARGANVNNPGFLGNGPLMGAVIKGSREVTEYLVTHGANPNSRTFGGGTPLTYAVDTGKTDIVRILLDHGGDTETNNSDNLTCVTSAVLKHYNGILKLLIDHGAKIEATTYSDGKTVLMRAAEIGNADAVKILLEGGANASAGDSDLRTALDYATAQNQAEVVELLRSKTDVAKLVQSATARFQNNTFDGHLRARIIARALEMNPGPDIPEEARRHFDLGIEARKQTGNLIRAQGEFHTAANIAPWYARAYYEAGMTMASGGNRYAWGMAVDDLKLYLLAAPHAPDFQEVKNLIEQLNLKAKQDVSH